MTCDQCPWLNNKRAEKILEIARRHNDALIKFKENGEGVVESFKREIADLYEADFIDSVKCPLKIVCDNLN